MAQKRAPAAGARSRKPKIVVVIPNLGREKTAVLKRFFAQEVCATLNERRLIDHEFVCQPVDDGILD